MIEVKYLAPLVFCILWLSYVQRANSRRFAWVTLFFVSIAAFSQNFEFIFRNFHQAIQVPMIIAGFIAIFLKKAPRIATLIFVVSFGSIGLSIAFSTLDADAITQLINFISSAGVASFLLTQFKKFNPYQYHLFAQFMVRLGLLVALTGIYEVANAGGERAEGTFANPNYFALFIGICYCFLFLKRLSKLDWVIASIMLLAITLSGSRSAIMIPAIGHLWAIWKSDKLRSKMQKIAILSVSVLLGAVFLSGLLEREGADASDAERKMFLRIGWNMALDHPISGVGWGRYPAVFSDYAPAVAAVLLSDQSEIDVAKQERRVSHNDFIRILAELGFPSALLFILLSILALVAAFRAKGPLSNLMMPVVLGLLLFSATHNNLNTAMTWFFLTLPFTFSTTARSKR